MWATGLIYNLVHMKNPGELMRVLDKLGYRFPAGPQNIFEVRYPLVLMRPQTLNYWNEPIPERTQFAKNRVGIPAIFAKAACG